MPPGPITGPAAWLGEEMASNPDRWIYTFDDQDLAEIDTAIHGATSAGINLADLTPETFVLKRLGDRLKDTLREVTEGRGFVMFRGFPVHKYSMEQIAAGYLGLGSYLGRFRPTNAKGHLLGHVANLGKDINKPDVRYYQTDRGLEFHTDSADIVGLICLQTSKSGGASRIVSSTSLYNIMLRDHPELCRALFTPLPTDRRGEVPEGMLPYFEVPVFSWLDGHLTSMYAGQYVRSAQANFPEARRLTDVEHAAIDKLDEYACDPKINLQMEFRPGDIQYLHNHQILHSREDFEDWPELERRRHLLRLWISPEKSRRLPELFAARWGSLTPGERGGIISNADQFTVVLEPQ